MNALALYQYTDKELKELLSTLTVLIDTREQENHHILQYFESKKISYKVKKNDTADYAAMIPRNPELGIARDLFIPVAIERKNSVDELAASIKDRTRFENELIRSQKLNFTMVVEDPNGYENIILGKFRSQYDPKALLASLKTFEARYDFTTVFIPKIASGNYIYHHLYYQARCLLKG
ncbi:ERCC4 domain-containing protein [Neobacillus jeddahensis]|uniref:ERCC4 domain-containing protein n=1 Tax=Neobacillus jeddahensis TaxID=1461580 RepID=UPI0005A6D5B3|nr:ERCC4 domain-containing protein [Neobacillus jeddahensis]